MDEHVRHLRHVAYDPLLHLVRDEMRTCHGERRVDFDVQEGRGSVERVELAILERGAAPPPLEEGARGALFVDGRGEQRRFGPSIASGRGWALGRRSPEKLR